MAVLQCAGCERFISLSAIAGGNPVATADPERWSTRRWTCAACKRSLCDRCEPRRGAVCPVCGQGTAGTSIDSSRRDLLAGRRYACMGSMLSALQSYATLSDSLGALSTLAWLGVIVCYGLSARKVGRAAGVSAFERWLLSPLVFVPLLNIVPVAYLLVRAHQHVNDPIADVPRAKVRLPVPPPQAAKASNQDPGAAVERPEPVRTAMAQAKPFQSGAAERAIACVRNVLSEDIEDGAPLAIRLSAPVDGKTLDGDAAPVVLASKGFMVVFLVDQGSFYTYLNAGDLREAGMTEAMILSTGLRNLRARAFSSSPGLNIRGGSGVFALTMGGNFESSMVLIDELWDKTLKAHLPNGPVVAIPSRDICVFCDARSADGVQRLRDLTRRVTDGGKELVSDKLVRRQGGRWVPLE